MMKKNIIKMLIIPKKFLNRYKNFTVTHTLKIEKEFLNIFLAVLKIQNCLMFEFLTKQRKNLFTQNKQRKPRKKVNQTVHFVL